LQQEWQSQRWRFEKGETMKSVPAVEYSKQKVRRLGLPTFALALVLCGMTLWLCGCSFSPGETRAESSRRHQRVLRLNTQEMMADIDTALLLDQPSRLTDRRLP
jgi:hypothetical protein